MQQPLEFNQIFYSGLIYDIEKEWQCKLSERERNLAILAYRYGRTAEAENEIKILFAK